MACDSDNPAFTAPRPIVSKARPGNTWTGAEE
jgi:hypothetical protein